MKSLANLVVFLLLAAPPSGKLRLLLSLFFRRLSSITWLAHNQRFLEGDESHSGGGAELPCPFFPIKKKYIFYLFVYLTSRDSERGIEAGVVGEGEADTR